jgi:predicted AAA+ superfamily ATPase
MAVHEFRLSYHEARAVLTRRLSEPGPGRVQLLVGPRQVGKTTLLLEIVERFGPTAIYAAADGPEAALPGFWERLWARAADTATGLGRAVVLIDEAHVLHDWAGRLKAEWDRVRRRKLAVQIVATGSSALRLAAGSRESLAGRFERITLTHWSASSLANVFGLPENEACDMLVQRGAYPGAFELRGDLRRWSAYVRDSILEPAIGRDLLALGSVRKPALLRQVFGICAASPTRILSLQKIQGQLQDPGALETIAHYLALLEEAFLIAPLAKHASGPARQRSSPPKLIPLSNALIAVTDPRGIPDREREPDRWGVWVENACLAHAWNAGQRVTYWREQPFEVDAVIEGSWGSWAVEVKTGSASLTDLRGLGDFVRRYPDYRPLIVCDDIQSSVLERSGFETVSWTDFLLHGPPGARPG